MAHLRGTTRQLQALRALIEHGSHKAAAHSLGITERSLARRIEGMRIRNGAISTVQLAWMSGRQDLQMPVWPPDSMDVADNRL